MKGSGQKQVPTVFENFEIFFINILYKLLATFCIKFEAKK